MSSPIQIDLLYFEGCPSYKNAWSDLLDVVVEQNLNVSVRPINVDNLDKANDLKFAGSPSIKINGVDLEEYEGQGVMACRVYQENDNKGWPSKDLLEKRLLEAAM